MATYKNNTPSRRRGVILLVLLGMLALFGATAFAFLVIASHGNRTAKSLQKIDRVLYSPRQDLEEGMRQALRGTYNTRSVLRYQSLMEDIYGGDYLYGYVINGYTLAPDDGGDYTNPKGLAPVLLPLTTTRPWEHQSPIGDGQLIEFTAGYTVPRGAPIGGLFPPGHANAGSPAVGGSNAPQSLTVPAWFGAGRWNYIDNDISKAPVSNEAVEFQRRVGCVLTIIDPKSTLYNRSTRIVGYRRVQKPATGAPLVVYHRYQILPFEGIPASTAIDYFGKTQNGDADFVINGTPFSGMGAGFRMGRPRGYVDASDPGTADQSLPSHDELHGMNGAGYDDNRSETDKHVDTYYPFALLPNPTDPDYHNTNSWLVDPTTTAAYTGSPYCFKFNSPNEGYDAPDYQNMLLALEQWDGTAMTLTRSPSLHRPALANYWIHRLASQFNAILGDELLAWSAVIQPYGRDGVRNNGDDPAISLAERDSVWIIKRRCLLRPLREDHPNFDGSNSNNWPTYAGEDLTAYSDPLVLEKMAQRSWGAADLAPGATVPWDNEIAGAEVVPWDVDTDGDGIADSIWVDIGLSVRTLPDGREIKPLVAMHCIDLDGKINLNTAGSLEQLHDKYTVLPISNELRSDYLRDNTIYAQALREGAGAVLSGADLHRGQGCGPAEIGLYRLFLRIAEENGVPAGNQHAEAMRLYRKLLLGWEETIGNNRVEFDGRYGELNSREAVGSAGLTEFFHPAPGATNSTEGADALAASRLLGLPANYYNTVFSGSASAYGSPLDLKGTLTTGLDVFGQPIYSLLRCTAPDVANGIPNFVSGWNTQAWRNCRVDTPYELMLGGMAAQSVSVNSRVDSPFTIAELEPLLRRHDTDVLRLPDRLRRLLEAGPNSQFRLWTTSESWDLPVPSLAMPRELLDDWQLLGQDPRTNYESSFKLPTHITDLIAAQAAAMATSIANPSHPTGENALRIDTSTLLSAELLMGMRMDLNRPFGNGVDDLVIDTSSPTDGIPDIGNGIVDEPGERFDMAAFFNANDSSTWARSFEQFSFNSSDFRFDADNDGFEWRNHDNTGASQNVIDAADHLIAIQEHVQGSPNEDPMYSYRQAYARHLYVLMMALVDKDWYPEWDDVIADALDKGTTPSATEKQQARARAIAQWAINVVDFRDADSIMTPFEYDIYPFAPNSGSAVALPGQLLATWDALPNGVIDPNCAYVWGCERPELLITETLAFHDRRTEDTAEEQNGTTTGDATDPDTDFDQKYRPLGSFFVELYNPSAPSEPRSGEFCRNHTNYNDEGGVILTQTTGTAGTGDPVWRLAVIASQTSGTPTYDYVDPQHSQGLGITPERLVYFIEDNGSMPSTSFQGVNYQIIHTPSSSVATSLVLEPHRYAVIGPGMDDGSGNIATTTLIGEPSGGSPPSLRRIELDPTGTSPVKVFNDGATDDVAARLPAIHQPKSLVIDQPQRLSVSEPVEGYTVRATSQDGTSVYDPVSQMIAPPSDVPLDSLKADGSADPNWVKLGENGTHSTFRYVHLQRLADPTQPYDDLTNPYITVDSAPVDLTVFNGRDNSQVPEPGVTAGTYATDGATPANDSLNSRQRGDNITNPPLWLFGIPTDLPKTKLQFAGPLTNQIFDKPLAHTLGWVNEWYGDPLDPTVFSVPTAYRGAPGVISGTSPDQVFTPSPFPWITWLNRPFANTLELLQVPAVRASRFLLSYENDLTKAPSGSDYYTAGFESFPHLASFFSAIDTTTAAGGQGRLRGFTTAGNSIPANGSDFYRLLEYVQVPSRFVGSYTHGAPSKMVGQQLQADPSREEPQHVFHPPFNNIPTFREPGKLNLNTINEPEVLAGLKSDHAERRDWNGFYQNEWPAFLNARRSYQGLNFGLETATSSLAQRLPTRIANPFRPFDGANLLPALPGRDGADNPSTPDMNECNPFMPQVIQEGVNSTLLRAKFNSLLEPLNQRQPLLANSSSVAYKDSQKNPFFQYESLQRLSGLTTNRSNVYAMWITVGYFEVEKNPGFVRADPLDRQIYPDGYTLGQELGIDAGDVRRHRAFYIIDRSIPVGFIPGEDLNTEKAVLIRRFIE